MAGTIAQYACGTMVYPNGTVAYHGDACNGEEKIQ